MRLFILVFYLICFYHYSQAQKDPIRLIGLVGYAKAYEEGEGFTLGLNASQRFHKKTFIEGQVSFSHVVLISSIPSETEHTQYGFALLGGRHYFIEEPRNIRLYAHVLGGGVISRSYNEFQSLRSNFLPTASIGVFVEVYRFVFGASAELFGNLNVNAGYILSF